LLGFRRTAAGRVNRPPPSLAVGFVDLHHQHGDGHQIYDASSAAQSAHRVAVEVTCSVDGLDAAPAGLVRSANR